MTREGPVTVPGVAADLVEAVRVRLSQTGAAPTAAQVAAALRAERAVLGDAEVLAVARKLRAHLIGAGPLEALLAEPGVTDILVNGPREVWVDDGDGLRRTSVTFPGDDEVRRLAQRLAAAAGRRLDDACPYVDARLAGGVRLHAVLPPIAAEGTCLSLRLPSRRAFTVEELAAEGGAAVLRAIMAARLAFLVTGGTGTGKTTMLSAMLSLMRPGGASAAGRGLRRAAARAPARRTAGGTAAEPGRRGRGRAARSRTAGPPDAARSPRRGRGARSRGCRSPCRPQHGPRGRLRHAAREQRRRRAREAGGSGLCGRAVAGGGAQSDRRRARSRHPPRAGGRGGRRRVAEICVLERGPSGLVTAAPALTFDPDGRARRGPSFETLRARCPSFEAVGARCPASWPS